MSTRHAIASKEEADDAVARISSPDKRQASPLFLAAGRGFLETVQALLEARADPNGGDVLFGRTPLWEAASFGQVPR